MNTQVRIERYADQGRCVAHIDGRVVFVRFALPGELVTIRLDEPHDRDDRFWTGEVTEVIEPSPDRVDPVWPLAGPLAWGGGVGGADMVHVSIPGQLKWKSSTISEQMRRLGHMDVDVPVAGVPDDVERRGLGWRTRIEMIADDDGRPSMRRRESHTRVSLDAMPLATDALNAVADELHVWDGGFTPGSQIRLAVPEPRNATAGLPPQRGELSAQQTEGGLASSNSSNYALLIDGKLRAGSQTLTETVRLNDGHEFTYTVDAGGFWQVHRQAPIALANEVIDLVRQQLDGATSAVLWDLYSGSGLFTLPLASATAERTQVLSIEGAKTAVKSAQRNLRAAGLDNVDSRAGDVSKTLRNIPKNLALPDVVVLDPPRAGAKRHVCEQIADSGARSVIYVACDPTSLARDTATLTDLGYDLAHIQGFDIYPNTHHVETVALFTK
ncbi:class I SAM-dependent RNA methyltransferase [Bifidobacterium callimiconis]|uniref:RNA methyltransferase n=1 Tax=Bifidobacterium callimiconis TaxID=2306973 RepID=A0A430FCX0_9BIFI|nr:TRAM domain-containing protein [Bifidobacterium callimiconis]MBT1176796.1 class I SAM-dependent RNA methyltransferase [Bifidobacterium callimiconis]RSX50695.1 RNA methyltransferase [Bifidobacterium callimiconis]